MKARILNKAGFNVVGIMILVAILGVLAAIVIPTCANQQWAFENQQPLSGLKWAWRTSFIWFALAALILARRQALARSREQREEAIVP